MYIISCIEKATPPIMVEHGPVGSSIPPPNCATSSSATPSASKPWRSKSLSAKHTATSSLVTVKQPPSASLEVPPKVIAQKSMLEKLKLFNSKPSFRSSKAEDPDAPEPEEGLVQVCPIHPDAHPGNQRPVTPSSSRSSSPKLALKGIAQLTLGRALAPKIASEKAKDKSKLKEKSKPGKQLPVAEPDHPTPVESKKSIPKANKSISIVKKDNPKAAVSGIPKPSQGGRGSAGNKMLVSPPCGVDVERPRNGKLGLSVHKGHKDMKSSDSSSSLVSEGKCNQDVVIGAQTHSIASNTVSVQLPQQQYNHPNTATVAPFMYR